MYLNNQQPKSSGRRQLLLLLTWRDLFPLRDFSPRKPQCSGSGGALASTGIAAGGGCLELSWMLLAMFWGTESRVLISPQLLHGARNFYPALPAEPGWKSLHITGNAGPWPGAVTEGILGRCRQP